MLAYRGLPWRRRLVLTAVWYVVPLINGLRIIMLLTSGKPLYQEATIIHAGRGSRDLIDLVNFVWRGVAVAHQRPHGHTAGVLPVVAILIFAGMIIGGFRTRAQWETEQPWRYPAMAVGGLALAPLAALVFRPSPGFLTDPLRVFAVAPAAADDSSLRSGGRRRALLGYAGIVAGVLLVPLVRHAAQAHRATGISDRMNSDGCWAPSPPLSRTHPDGTDLLVIDDHVLGDDVYALQGQLLVTALLYVRHAPDDVVTHCGPLGSPAIAGVTSGAREPLPGSPSTAAPVGIP